MFIMFGVSKMICRYITKNMRIIKKDGKVTKKMESEI